MLAEVQPKAYRRLKVHVYCKFHCNFGRHGLTYTKKQIMHFTRTAKGGLQGLLTAL